MMAGVNLPSDGDAIYFNALVSHRLRSVGNMPTSALVVISAEEEGGEM
jgi:mannose-6-phosphate isomerase-like protein (cupin superfamily)